MGVVHGCGRVVDMVVVTNHKQRSGDQAHKVELFHVEAERVAQRVTTTSNNYVRVAFVLGLEEFLVAEPSLFAVLAVDGRGVDDNLRPEQHQQQQTDQE